MIKWHSVEEQIETKLHNQTINIINLGPNSISQRYTDVNIDVKYVVDDGIDCVLDSIIDKISDEVFYE